MIMIIIGHGSEEREVRAELVAATVTEALDAFYGDSTILSPAIIS